MVARIGRCSWLAPPALIFRRMLVCDLMRTQWPAEAGPHDVPDPE
jgi:hypothetical protein